LGTANAESARCARYPKETGAGWKGAPKGVLAGWLAEVMTD